MEAIKLTRQNFYYIKEYVIKNAPWAADLEDISDANLANGEWTYVYTKTRGTGERAKMEYYHMSEKKFHETFEFTSGESQWSTMPITAK